MRKKHFNLNVIYTTTIANFQNMDSPLALTGPGKENQNTGATYFVYEYVIGCETNRARKVKVMSFIWHNLKALPKDSKSTSWQVV
jgi:ABC-type sugar transport system permease subunit